jgi:hypothetical protein
MSSNYTIIWEMRVEPAGAGTASFVVDAGTSDSVALPQNLSLAGAEFSRVRTALCFGLPRMQAMPIPAIGTTLRGTATGAMKTADPMAA